MPLDGADTEKELGGNLLVGMAGGRQPGDLVLLRGQLIPRFVAAFSDGLASGDQLPPASFGKCLRTHPVEHLEGGP